MNYKVIITLRHVYGVLKAYPGNDEARFVAAIAKSKTLTKDTLHTLVQAGATIHAHNSEAERHEASVAFGVRVLAVEAP